MKSQGNRKFNNNDVFSNLIKKPIRVIQKENSNNPLKSDIKNSNFTKENIEVKKDNRNGISNNPKLTSFLKKSFREENLPKESLLYKKMNGKNKNLKRISTCDISIAKTPSNNFNSKNGFKSPPINNKVIKNVKTPFLSSQKGSSSKSKYFASKYIKQFVPSNITVCSPKSRNNRDKLNISPFSNNGSNMQITESGYEILKHCIMPFYEICKLGTNYYNKMCLKHKEKKSKYISDLTDQINGRTINKAYCSKCSILLIKNGINCEEISSFTVQSINENQEELSLDLNGNQEQIQKKKELDNFIQELKTKKEIINKGTSIISNKIDAVQSKTQNQINEIKIFYNSLLNEIKNKMNKNIDFLEKIQFENFQILEKQKSTFENLNEDLEDINRDVSQHYSKIILEMEISEFKKIIKDYNNHLYSFLNIEDNLEQLNIKEPILSFPKSSFNYPEANINIKDIILKIMEIKELNLEESSESLPNSEKNIESISNYDLLQSHFQQKKETEREETNRSDVYISFDQNNSKIEEDMNEDSSLIKDKKSNISQKYTEILNNINRHQINNESQYEKLIRGLNTTNSNLKSERESLYESNEQIFEINKEEMTSDWEHKQTPELGERKATVPEYLENHFKGLMDDKGKEESTTVSKIETTDSKYKFACQRVLF